MVHAPEGRVLIKRCKKILFTYIDLTDELGGAAVMMVQIARQNFFGYTKQEVKKAIKARKLQPQGRPGNPREATFKGKVS